MSTDEKTLQSILSGLDIYEASATPIAIARAQEAANVYSFDREEFRVRLNSSEDWVKVIVAHLYVDSIIERMLFENIPNPAAIKNGRRQYLVDRVQLCSAINILPETLQRQITCLNGLRNGLAHSLKFRLEDKSIVELVGTLPEEARKFVSNHGGEKEAGNISAHLLRSLAAIVISAEVARQSATINRLISAIYARQAQAVLDRSVAMGVVK